MIDNNLTFLISLHLCLKAFNNFLSLELKNMSSLPPSQNSLPNIPLGYILERNSLFFLQKLDGFSSGLHPYQVMLIFGLLRYKCKMYGHSYPQPPTLIFPPSLNPKDLNTHNTQTNTSLHHLPHRYLLLTTLFTTHIRRHFFLLQRRFLLPRPSITQCERYFFFPANVQKIHFGSKLWRDSKTSYQTYPKTRLEF